MLWVFKKIFVSSKHVMYIYTARSKQLLDYFCKYIHFWINCYLFKIFLTNLLDQYLWFIVSMLEITATGYWYGLIFIFWMLLCAIPWYFNMIKSLKLKQCPFFINLSRHTWRANDFKSIWSITGVRKKNTNCWLTIMHKKICVIELFYFFMN